MRTEVTMKRELFGYPISQRSKSEFFSATDLVKAGNLWRRKNGKADFNLSLWLTYKQTKEFVDELNKKFGKAVIKGRGRGAHTWVHPLLFIDLALAISPQLKIEVYEWLFDHLLRHRNLSGDSYKKMCGVLWARHRNQRTFSDEIKKLARKIQQYCGVSDWQSASEAQLRRRDRIHEEIALLADVMNNNNEAIRIVFRRLNEEIAQNARSGAPLLP